jgi:hypothetical protein
MSAAELRRGYPPLALLGRSNELARFPTERVCYGIGTR